MEKQPNASSTSLFSTDIFDNAPTVPQPKSTEVSTILTKTEQDIYNSLKPEQRTQLAEHVRSIDFTQPNLTTEYGKDARTGIADINTKALSVTRTKDLGTAGKSMTKLMTQLKGLDLSNEPRAGILRRTQSYIARLNAMLTPVEANIQKAEVIMKKHQEQLAIDNGIFSELYKQNLAYYRALTLYIIAGKIKLDEERKTTLASLQAKARETGDMADVEAFNSYAAKLDQFDTLLNDFESSKTLCLQTAPSIRIAEQNNKLLIQKFDFIFVTAIPAWKTQIQIAINLENSRQAGAAANSAIDFTNEVIARNAEMLKEGAINTAKLAQREIISSDTLEYANQQLIEGIDEVLKIHAEGKAQREASRQKRTMLEEDLKNELLKLTA